MNTVQNGKGHKPRHVQNEHWRNEHDRIFKKKKKCSKDTNGDGDCGQPFCLECGKYGKKE